MPISFLYSNAVAMYLFDESFAIVEQQEWKPAEQPKVLEALAQGNWLEAEQALLRRRRGDAVVYVGYKQRSDTPLSQDIEKLTAITQVLGKTVNRELRTAALAHARRTIREKFRKDTLAVQVGESVAELDRVIEALMKRLREWYGCYLPEFHVENNRKFCALITEKSREVLQRECHVADGMGAALSKQDVEQIQLLAKRVLALYELQDREGEYLAQLLEEIMPSFHAIAGTQIAAKLLSLAGSMEKLAGMPASTIQLLGAEKALFRHLKTGARSPRFGVLAQHTIVSRAKESEKGRIARVLADKLSIAARVDHFSGKPIGKQLKAQIEQRFGRY